MFQFVIRRKTLISMLFIGLCLLGIVSYKQLPVEVYPNAELPFLIVNVSSFQQVDPEYMEEQAIIPLEGAVSTLAGIDKIESYADRRRGTITIYFNQDVKIKYAYLKLLEKVNAVRPSLADEFRVNVFKVDTGQLANMFMGLQARGSGGLDRIRYIVDQKVVPELENIDGIANVEVFGGRSKSVEIILNEQACRSFGVTASQIRTILVRNNKARTFVGHAFDNGEQYAVNLIAEYDDIEMIKNIIIDRNGPVRLRDVADVSFGVKEPTSISRVNGKEAITIQLVRDAQVNLINLSHTTQRVIEQLNEKLKSDGIELVIQTNIADEMEKNIDLIMRLAGIGGALAIVILWIFLKNLRLVVIIALAIPISILTAFNFFYAAGISINTLTLVGMALAVGMLLDNSVVVLENIYRLLSARKDADVAVIQGSKEVWRSIVAATLTTIMVFLPFVFSTNFLVRILGKHIGVSIISTLLVSLVVALLLIPMLTHFFIKRSGAKKQTSFNVVSLKQRMVQIYTLLLKSCIRFPARTIVAAALLFFASLFICLALSLNIPREIESREIKLYVTMPRGATLEKTDEAVSDLEKRLEGIPEAEEIVSQIYEEEAIITVKLKEDYQEINNRSIALVKREIEDRVDTYRAADVSFEQPQASQRFRGGMGRNPGMQLQRLLGLGSPQEKVVIKGNDFNAMRNIANDIRYYLEDLSSISRVRLNIADNRPEIHLLFDREILSYFNIPLTAIAAELATFQKEFSANVLFEQGTDQYDIVIKNDNLEDKTISDLRTLQIPSETGATYELQDVSQIVYSYGTSGINRVNQEKEIEVVYRFLSEVTDSKELLQAARREVDDLVANINIPSGMAVQVVHDENDLSDFYFLVSAAFLLIYMILASVFESLSTPVVMMFTIPMAAIGSLWALILTHNSLLNANTLVGFLILLGIVVNNGIIFIDYSRLLQKRGYRRSRALMMAGQHRVRPILITAITTIVAMLPLAMGKSEYVMQLGAPFAITVIGGLTVGTLFTLVFIPTVYSGLETSLAWLRSLPLKIKAIQVFLFVVGAILIYTRVYDVIWKFADFLLLSMLIPASTYFVMTSLRQARADSIKSDEPIRIKIQHLVKIYDQDARFVREWKKGKKIRERVAGRTADSRSDFEDFLWKIPLLIFLIYFVYFYVQSFFWAFVLAHAVYFYVLALWQPVEQFLLQKTRKDSTFAALAKKVKPVLLWKLPAINLFIFYFKWERIGVLILIAVAWYLGLIIYSASDRLYRDKIDINRLSGRFAGIRSQFYRFVLAIPILGRRKKPFKALDGISLEIGSGMFGLLGPNGAGKTTLMRILCGILEQSRGKVWINGIDLNEKREELQGLIGYLPQEFGAYENMTAYEFLSYQAILKNILDKEEREKRIRHVLQAVHLQDKSSQKIGSFSGGMKQRIGIAQTLLHLPRILVVDEPTAGLDPRERIRFRNLLVELSRERIVIFSTHIIEDISSSCNRVAVLNKGKLCYLGVPAHMTESARGFVWQFLVDAKKFESLRRKLWIVHHARIGDKIRVRCLAASQPTAEAKSVSPTLEDAYLWLLKGEGEKA